METPTSGVPGPLYDIMLELMSMDGLVDFGLGGGTNLALKYDHRLSVDIDLFSSSITGAGPLRNNRDELLSRFPGSKLVVNNRESDQFSWLTGVLVREGYRAKIDIVQNLKTLCDLEERNGIRLLDDLDIASLKLESMANRGSRKDLYDLVLLTDRYPLPEVFDLYIERKRVFGNDADKNIFNKDGRERSERLDVDLGALVNFNGAKDLSDKGNQVVLTENSPFRSVSYVDVVRIWKKRVGALSKLRNIELHLQKSIPARRKKRGRGL